MDGLTRREALGTTGSVIGAACLLGACQMHDKDTPPLITSGTVNVGPATNYPAGRAKLLPTYGIFIANDSGTPVAIRPKCTHLGCTVKWNESSHGYACPCHGSQFSLLGLPTAGPAKRPLPLIACGHENDGTLTVDLSRLYAL